MELVDCCSFVSTEQSDWANSPTPESEPVKEEPEWGESGLSEAAVAEGLYADHEIKDEVVIGPELLQQQDIAFSLQNAVCRAEDGPCWAKLGGSTDATDCTNDEPHWTRSTEQKYELQSCFVKLERLPDGDLRLPDLDLLVICCSKSCNSMQSNPSASALWRRGVKRKKRSCNLPSPLKCHQQSKLNITEENPCKLKPASRAEASPEWTHSRPGEGPRCNMSHKQQFELSSCSVRLDSILMKDLTCKTCLVTFDSKSSLQIHSCIDSVEEPNLYEEACDENDKTYFQCDNCGKQYLQKSHLLKHLATHVKPGGEILSQYLTDDNLIVNTEETHSYCDNITNTQYRNPLVLASHTGEKPNLLHCDTFTRNKYLIQHVTKLMNSVDNKLKLYKCDICNKCFTTLKSLTAHNRCHTRKKCYSCDICNKRFVCSSTLNEHKLIHTDEKPCSCNIVSHTIEKLYCCDICSKTFSQKSN